MSQANVVAETEDPRIVHIQPIYKGPWKATITVQYGTAEIEVNITQLPGQYPLAQAVDIAMQPIPTDAVILEAALEAWAEFRRSISG